MSPKEKAKELYCKYTDALNIRDLQITANPFAKQCALIAVEEIINGYEFDSLDIENKRIMDNINYWDKVKQEINNL